MTAKNDCKKTGKKGGKKSIKIDALEKNFGVTCARINERLDKCEEGLVAIETILRGSFPALFETEEEHEHGD